MSHEMRDQTSTGSQFQKMPFTWFAQNAPETIITP